VTASAAAAAAAAARPPVVRREAHGRAGPPATGDDEAGTTAGGVRIRRRRSVTVRGHRRRGRRRRRVTMGKRSGRLVLGGGGGGGGGDGDGDGGRMGMVDGPDVFQHERRPERLFRRIILLLFPCLRSRRSHSLFGVVVVVVVVIAARRGRDALLVVRPGGAAVAAGHAIGGRDERVVPVIWSIAIAHVALLTRFDPGDVVLARRRSRSRSRLRSARRQRRRLSAIAIAGTGRRHDLKYVYVGSCYCYEFVLILHPYDCLCICLSEAIMIHLIGLDCLGTWPSCHCRELCVGMQVGKLYSYLFLLSHSWQRTDGVECAKISMLRGGAPREVGSNSLL